MQGTPSDLETAAPGTDLGAVSREMVRLFKEQFGRGPTRARAHWAGPDTVVCVLEDTLTPAERKLVELGEHQAVREMRMALQHATVPEFCAPVEGITGRKVRAFTSALDTVADGLALEVWVLHPVGYEGEGRVEVGTRTGEISTHRGRREREDEGAGPNRPS